jgi:hypothetical protein
MEALRWQHGQTADAVRSTIEEQLIRAGYPDKLKWQGNAFSAAVGFGTVLKVQGQITDRDIVIERCDGFLGNIALKKIQDTLPTLFPSSPKSENEAPLACQSR